MGKEPKPNKPLAPALQRFVDSFDVFADVLEDEVVVLSRDFTIVKANAAYLRKGQWTQEEIVGRHCFEVSHGLTAPCSEPNDICPLIQSLNSGLPSRTTHVHKDSLGNENYVDIVTSPIKEEDGSIVGALELMRDVTIQKRLEKALTARNEDLTILDNIIVAGNRGSRLQEILHEAIAEIVSSKRVDAGWTVIFEDTTGTAQILDYQGVSSEFMQAIADTPLQQTLCGQADHPDRPLYIPDLSEAENSNTVVAGEGLRALLCVPLPIHDRVLGRITFARRSDRGFSAEEIQLFTVLGEQLGIIVDRTKLFSSLELYAARLEEGNRRREEFSAMVSHELRNKFGLLKGWVQILQRIGFDPSGNLSQSAKSVVERLVSQTDGLARLADDLDDISALEAGRFAIQTKSFDIVALTKEVVEQQQTLSTNHRINLTLQEESIIGMWDSDRIRQVLVNLLSNAIKYSPRGGDIDISIVHAGDDVVVSVSDNGLGISAEEQKHIFLPYVRAHKEIKGKGLGLFICKGIIDAHNGRIWVESEVGEGSTFYFSLPATS